MNNVPSAQWSNVTEIDFRCTAWSSTDLNKLSDIGDLVRNLYKIHDTRNLYKWESGTMKKGGYITGKFVPSNQNESHTEDIPKYNITKFSHIKFIINMWNMSNVQLHIPAINFWMKEWNVMGTKQSSNVFSWSDFFFFFCLQPQSFHNLPLWTSV